MKNPSIESLAALINSQSVLGAVKEIEDHITYIDVVANCTDGAYPSAQLHGIADHYKSILYSAISLGQDAVIYGLASGLAAFTNQIPLHGIGEKVQLGVDRYKAAHPEYNALSRKAGQLLNPVAVKAKLIGWLVVAVEPGQDLTDPIGQRLVYADGKQCTSRIASIDKENARVTTASGSIYELGLPSGVCRNIVKPEVMKAFGF